MGEDKGEGDEDDEDKYAEDADMQTSVDMDSRTRITVSLCVSGVLDRGYYHFINSSRKKVYNLASPREIIWRHGFMARY